MAKINLSPPWVSYYHEVQAFFKEDPDVRVLFDDVKYEIRLYVEDPEKADALSQLLKPEVVFGSVVLSIIVVPSNKVTTSKESLFEKAFKNNEAVSFLYCVKSIFSNDLLYVVFEKEVVQCYTDDLGDIYGVRSTLYQNIAKEIFKEYDGVFFCTDTYEDSIELGSPLGEWP